jgi:PAS domain S-box-containing protein
MAVDRNRLKILLVEDNPGDARLIREMLGEAEAAGFEIDWVSRLSAALEKLSRDEIDLVLLDLGLPDSRGLDTFRQAYSHTPQVPFVVLTGLNDETLALTAVREGAQDYLVKGQTDGGTLLRAIRYATERKKIDEDLREVNEALRREIEERRAAEMALDAERQRLYALLDGLPAMVNLKGPDYSIRFANRVFRETFGDWEGKRCFEVVGGRTGLCQNCPTAEVLNTGLANSREWTDSVRGLTYHLHNYAFADVDGSKLVLSLGIDITGRKQAEDAIKEHEEELTTLYENAPLIMVLVDEERRVLKANKFAELFTGTPAADLIDRRAGEALRCLHSLDDPGGCGCGPFCQRCPVRSAVVKTFETGCSHNQVEACLPFPINGKAREVTFLLSTARLSVRGQTQVLVTIQDISERKQAEETVQQQLAFQQVLMDTIPVPIFYKDAQGIYLGCNKAFEAFFGLSQKEIIGKSVYGISPRELADVYHEKDRELMEHHGTQVYEYMAKDATGNLHDVILHKATFLDGSGAVAGIIGGLLDITERKQAEAALRQSEQKYCQLVKTIPAVVFEGYADWSINFFDDKIEELTGYQKEDFNCRRLKWSDLIFPEELDGAKRAFIKALKDDGSYVREYRIRTKGGRPLWIQARGQISYKPDGKIDLVRGVFFDISERKAAEKALQQSEARLAKAQRLAHLGHWEWDLSSDQAVCSDEIYRIFGVNQEKFTPSFESVMNYVHPDDVERIRHHFAEALATAKPFSLVGRIVRPDGAVRYVHSQAEVAFDEKGKPRRMLGTAQDITERRIAEMRLRDSEARFRAIFDGSAMGIGLTDMRGRFLTTNKTLRQMLGLDETEINGKTCLDFTHADDQVKSRELFLELITGRRDHLQVEKRFCRQDGESFWARVTVSLVKDAEDRPLYSIGMVEDITQAKQAEEKLQASEANLRYLTSQLITAQEDERRRIARELHDELGQSLLVLKLQARCVERGLQANQGLLRQECGEMLENFDRVVDNVRRLSRDLSPTILEDLGLAAALQRLLQDFSKHYCIELCADPIEGMDSLFLPEAKLAIYRIFQESLTNIGKHSRATKLTVSVNRDDDHISFLIEDNGQGFSPSEGRRRTPGMGLAAMEERARMVGGVLTVWSREGAGTRVSLDIPFPLKPKSD